MYGLYFVMAAFDALPLDIRKLSTIQSFKTAIKAYLLND